ncbi:MAG: 4-hydroxybutyrate CoA-transferase [Gammaproteobacteria bacterium]|jgi:4-hydroxybutyrate CoA-transferase|nr:4-hydroxybutyrate CoA-transferase [Gammaproteobacteria bacterium]MBT5203577.1 4-hydroxybutyrate CoA-transferase [Gammaproteobacteria bacterium]MBT5601140.1 4-hydroxybutyrate CoA-transferase [Gammaproteobacteria bacterium]MBT6246968.1 4-hydroxybutyrate CoA-transferase [Gammaproteobacteria bacterium]
MLALADILKSQQRIFVTGSSNEPTTLINQLAQVKLPDHLEFLQFPLAGYNQTDFTQFNSTAAMTTFFMTPSLVGADPRRLKFLPMQMRAIYDYLSSNVDVAVVQIARDRNGILRLGPNVDFAGAVLNSATVILAELNHSLTAAEGCPPINNQQIDFLFESERPLRQQIPPEIDAKAARIGAFVAELINDGDCLQTGIGAIPAAILQQLEDKSDLGFHGGLIDDAGMNLIRRGNVTGQKKTLDRGLHITGMALGSSELHDWLGSTPEVAFRGANYTHELATIRQLPNFVSVNSAVEIDLYGQVNAEYAGGKQISGTGGSVDFMRAAKASPGGRSIVAMTATARRGSVSRIVPKVEMVTALRTDVDIVVTEYGIADIKYLPNQARAEALINIAAPQFRDDLRGGLYST